MGRDEFLSTVGKRSQLEDPQEVEQATAAVLETLGEFLYRTEAGDLAAELPRGIKEYIYRRQPPETSHQEVVQLSREEFLNRVSARAETGYPGAVKVTQAVARTLNEAVSSGQMDDVRKDIPRDVAQLFR